MDFLSILTIFLLVSIVITYLIKKYTNQQTFFVISMIRTKKPLRFFDMFSKHKTFLEWFTTIGLILGFGAFAVDYLFFRKEKTTKRLILFALSTIALTILFYGLDIFLGNFISKSPLTQNHFSLIAILFGIFGFAGFVILTLFFQGLDIVSKMLLGIKPCPGVAPIIPGVKVPNVPLTVPLHAWLSLLIILIIHEGMHGIIARWKKIKVKSTGFLLLGFLPIGAFVEPDEKQLKKLKDKDAMQIFVGGPAANLFALILIQVFLLILVLLISTFVTPWSQPIHEQSTLGVEIVGTDHNTTFCGDVYLNPAHGIFKEGWLIKKVNGQKIRFTGDVQMEVLKKKFEPTEFELLNPDTNQTTTHILNPNELGMFGFQMQEIQNPDYVVPELYEQYRFGLALLNEFIGWLFLLNLLVAIINFLPLPVFDGGRIVKLLFRPYLSFLKMSKKDTEKLIGRIFLWIIMGLMLVNALPLFL